MTAADDVATEGVRTPAARRPGDAAWSGLAPSSDAPQLHEGAAEHDASATVALRPHRYGAARARRGVAIYTARAPTVPIA